MSKISAEVDRQLIENRDDRRDTAGPRYSGNSSLTVRPGPFVRE